MTPEKQTNDYWHGRFQAEKVRADKAVNQANIYQGNIVEACKRASNEAARADKAEEMVAGFRKEAWTLNLLLRDTYSDIESFWTEDDGEPTVLCKQRMMTLRNARARLEPIVTNTEQTSQAHNKRKCDEIVGKIEASQVAYPRCIEDSRINDGLEKAIDIVKSVLGGEG